MKIAEVPNTWILEEGLRLDPRPYVGGAMRLRKLVLELPHSRLETVTTGFRGGIFTHLFSPKRTYVSDRKYGVPFLGASSMLQADLSDLPLLSNRDADSRSYKPLKIQRGMTLISCSGSVGRMTYARASMEGMASAGDLLKVQPDPDKIPPGYLYAFLRSEVGAALVGGGTYGTIVQHLERQHIADIPVPRIGAKAEREIHLLVEKAADSRDRAHQLRRDAQDAFYRHCGLSESSIQSNAKRPLSFSVRASSLRRLDAAHYHPANREAAEQLGSCSDTKRLNEVARVFTPGIFKRIHVDDPNYGYPYFSGTELFQYDPDPRGHLSRRAPKIDDYIVRVNWLLIQDAGQLQGLIGRLVRVTPAVDKSVVSNHLMRIAAEDAEASAYLSVVLSSPHGYRAITRNAFGSSIPQLDPAHIGALRLPWPTAAIRKRIAEPVLEAWKLEDEASANVRKATKRVEDAIEKGASN